jgi:phosphate transport system substrate-binding protein
MRAPRRSTALTGAFLCAAAFVGAGCGPDPGVVGSVRVGGSPALLTFVQQAAAAFTSQHPLARVRVDLTSTDDGYSLLCDGISDAATATRPATPREERACAASDVRFVPLLVGRNAIVAFTARNSRVPGCLNTTDLRALTGATPRPRATWRGLGDASLPVVVVVPEAGSSTRDAFESRVLADPAAGDPVALRADAVPAAAGDPMVARVTRTRGAIGITGFAALQPIPPGVRVIEVNGGDGCVEPSAASIASKAYPLTTDLFMAVRSNGTGENAEAVAAFGDVVASPGILGRPGSGLSPSDITATEAAWRSRSTEGDS